jgi:carbamoyl-phosphate synthase large subunit
MEICPDDKALRHYMATAVNISELDGAPVLIDRFLDDATEVDVDVIADYATGGEVARWQSGRVNAANTGHSATSPLGHSATSIICGVLEHIEQAGIHSGDSACTLPPWSLSASVVARIKDIGHTLARELKVNGLMNLQLAIKGDQIYILEVNPRASRTVPFVGKATHTPWARLAAKVMMGQSLADLNVREAGVVIHGSADTRAPAYAVKESVFPFSKFPGVDVVLGPEMRSTGEVMGIDPDLAIAFAKSQIAAGNDLPTSGNVFISVRDDDRQRIVEPARTLQRLGFGIYATGGTAEHLRAAGITSVILQKIGAGARPNVIDLMADGKLDLVINTPTRTGWQTDEGRIRAATVRFGIPMITTTTGAKAAVDAIAALRTGDWGVRAMQDYRPQPLASGAPVVRPGHSGTAHPVVPR